MNKQLQFKLILALLLIFIAVNSCKKDDNLRGVATIINQGDPAADGCGWLLTIGNSTELYKPDNLPEKYKVENLKIEIIYTILPDHYTCGYPITIQSTGFAKIHLINVKKYQ